MNKFKLLCLSLLSIAVVFSGNMVHAAPLGGNSKEQVCQGVGVDCTAPETKVNSVVNVGLTLFRVIIGVIAVFFIIYAGLKFITSSGDASKVASARNTIIYAAIGLVIVVVAPAIIGFVLNRI